MKKHFLYFILVLFSSLSVLGQENKNYINVVTVNGPMGNYLYINEDISSIDKNEEFEIERLDNYQIPFPEKKEGKGFKKIGTLQRINNYKDLSTYFSETDLAEMKKNFGGISNNQLANKFKNLSKAEDLPFYFNNVQTKRALGIVFLDENVEEGVVYYYRVHRKSDPKKHFGWSLCKGGMGNYILPNLKAKWAKAQASDSLINVMWKLNLDKTQESFPITKEENDEQFNAALHGLPFPYSSLSAKVMTLNGNSWTFAEDILPDYNEEDNSLEFRWRKNSTPKEITQARLILVDEVYNEGGGSDTAFVIAVDSSMVELIYGINVQDTLNGIHVSWNPLPNEPYYAGVEITRYDSDDVMDTTVILAPNRSSYMDRNMTLGNYYRYQVKALFVPQAGLVQTIPAQGVGTFSRFTKPLPPFNLKAETVDNFIKLDWEHAQEETVYGYYIYRGTSPEDLELAAGPIKEATYIDSLEALSGRTHYFYTVASQNYRQDTSAYSKVVSIKPDKAIEMMEPSNVNVYFANGEIHLDWRDVRNGDNIIEGYVVERKLNNETEYQLITTPFTKKASFIDKDVELGNTYYYRVASRSIYGDLSKFSDGTIFKAEKEKVMTLNEFSVRNVSNGIHISLPKITVANRKAYNIYKKEASEKDFSKIITLNSKTFDFVDQAVEKNKLYVYYITLTETDDREGSKGKSKTLRRK